MHKGIKLFLSASLALLLLPAAFAAPPDNKLAEVLRKLDAAAANFHSTSADFEFDSVQTDPIPDKDVQNRHGLLRAQRIELQDGSPYRPVQRQACPQGV